MGRTISYVPGFEGRFSENQKQIGITLPAKYIEYVLNEVQKSGVEASIQTIIKMAMVRAFPVPGYEEETELFMRRFFKGTSANFDAPIIQREPASEKETDEHVEKLVKQANEKSGYRSPEPIGNLDGGYYVEASSRKSGVQVNLKHQSDDSEVLINEWTHKDFYKTKIFIQEQSKAIGFLKGTELELDKEELADAIETALFNLFEGAYNA